MCVDRNCFEIGELSIGRLPLLRVDEVNLSLVGTSHAYVTQFCSNCLSLFPQTGNYLRIAIRDIPLFANVVPQIEQLVFF